MLFTVLLTFISVAMAQTSEEQPVVDAQTGADTQIAAEAQLAADASPAVDTKPVAKVLPIVDHLDIDLARMARNKELLPLPMVREYVRRYPERKVLPNGKSADFFRKYPGYLPYEECAFTPNYTRLGASAIVGTESMAESSDYAIRCVSKKHGIVYDLPVNRMTVSTVGLSLGLSNKNAIFYVSKLTGRTVADLFSGDYTGMSYGLGLLVGGGYTQMSNAKGIRIRGGAIDAALVELKIAHATARFARRKYLRRCGDTAPILGTELVPNREDECLDFAEKNGDRLPAVDWNRVDKLIFWYVGD